MTEITHPEMVRVLTKPGAAILEQMTPEKANLWHAATGIAGEGGEILDGIKRHTVYNKPLDRANIVEELGDMEFFLEQLRSALDITREETLEGNIAKLRVRYDGLKYSDAAAHARADKTGG